MTKLQFIRVYASTFKICLENVDNTSSQFERFYPFYTVRCQIPRLDAGGQHQHFNIQYSVFGGWCYRLDDGWNLAFRRRGRHTAP